MDHEAFDIAIDEALRGVFGHIDQRHSIGATIAEVAVGNSTVGVGAGAVAYIPPYAWLIEGGLFILKKISGAEKKEKIGEEKKIQEEIENNKRKLLESISNLEPGISNELIGKDLQEIKRIVKQHSIQQADTIVARKDIRKRLCLSLKTATDDVFDISKSISPVLVGCIASGTISIPLNPVLFAAIAVVIARMGIAALCASYIAK